MPSIRTLSKKEPGPEGEDDVMRLRARRNAAIGQRVASQFRPHDTLQSVSGDPTDDEPPDEAEEASGSLNEAEEPRPARTRRLALPPATVTVLDAIATQLMAMRGRCDAMDASLEELRQALEADEADRQKVKQWLALAEQLKASTRGAPEMATLVDPAE